MNMYQAPKVTVAVLIVLGIILSFCPDPAQPLNQETTNITPHMDVPLEPGRNVLFCSTFQLAWNEMKNNIIREDIRLEKPLEMVRRLNSGRATKADISEEDYLSMVGYGADNIADKINRALRTKFGDGAPVVDDIYNDDDIILAYAFLWKELQFANAFEDCIDPIHFNAGGGRAPVEGFGIVHYAGERHSNLRDQVEIIEYEHPGDFIVGLASTNPDDEIILANVSPGRTLLDTYEQVNRRAERARRGTGASRLGDKDVLLIPKFDVAIDHRYASLLGLHLRNEGFQQYFVAEARQDVRFRLDECGAAVKSEAILAIKKGPMDFKLLRFDKPFLLYLKKKGAAYPYLAVWVENTELMVQSS
jgi:hypothetical protein